MESVSFHACSRSVHASSHSPVVQTVSPCIPGWWVSSKVQQQNQSLFCPSMLAQTGHHPHSGGAEKGKKKLFFILIRQSPRHVMLSRELVHEFVPTVDPVLHTVTALWDGRGCCLRCECPENSEGSWYWRYSCPKSGFLDPTFGSFLGSMLC